MTRIRHIIFFIAAAIAGGVGGILLFDLPDRPHENGAVDSSSEIKDKPTYGKKLVHLYFAEKDNSFLASEERVVSTPVDAAEFGKELIEMLIAGSQGVLMRTIPEHAGLRALYLIEDGTAVVDMSEGFSRHHPGGVRTELLSVYSIVNSLILNINEIKSVKILVGGREAETLAGHIDLRSPFKADMLLIR